MKLYWLGAVAPLILLARLSTAQVSTFDSSAEGWISVELDCDPFVSGTCPPTTNPPTVEPVPPVVPDHIATGGNPDGHITADDPDGLGTAGGAQFWRAPASYLGDKSAKLGGALNYDVRNTCPGGSCTAFQIEEAMLVGGGLTLVHSTASDPMPSTWTRFQIPVDVGAWVVIGSSGQQATETQLRSVLSSLNAIYLRAEYLTFQDVQSLDNVALTDGPAAVPGLGVSGWFGLVALLGALGASRIARRRSLTQARPSTSGIGSSRGSFHATDIRCDS